MSLFLRAQPGQVWGFGAVRAQGSGYMKGFVIGPVNESLLTQDEWRRFRALVHIGSLVKDIEGLEGLIVSNDPSDTNVEPYLFHDADDKPIDAIRYNVGDDEFNSSTPVNALSYQIDGKWMSFYVLLSRIRSK